MKVLSSLFVFLLSLVFLLNVGTKDVKAEVIAYDSAGQFLGVHINFDSTGYGSADIYNPSINATTKISLSNGDIATHNIFFNKSNCTGIPYVDALYSYIIFKNGENYYIGEQTTPISTQFQVKSYWHSDGTCKSGGWNSTNLVPVKEYDIEQLPFNLPAVLPLSFEHEPAHPGKWKKDK